MHNPDTPSLEASIAGTQVPVSTFQASRAFTAVSITPSMPPSATSWSSSHPQAKNQGSVVTSSSPTTAFNFEIPDSLPGDDHRVKEYLYKGDGKKTNLENDLLSLVRALHPEEEIVALRDKLPDFGVQASIHYGESSVQEPDDPGDMGKERDLRTEGTLYVWHGDNEVTIERFGFKDAPGRALRTLRGSMALRANGPESTTEAEE